MRRTRTNSKNYFGPSKERKDELRERGGAALNVKAANVKADTLHTDRPNIKPFKEVSMVKMYTMSATTSRGWTPMATGKITDAMTWITRDAKIQQISLYYGGRCYGHVNRNDDGTVYVDERIKLEGNK
jgi:hypothetical protein